MKILRHADLVPVPWKNGGGVTREIARHEVDGNIIWRLSIADVALPGPFSAFPGLLRILTVIEGAGMVLERFNDSALNANLFEPVAFSGDEPINGLLPVGPCRDFNIIWNPNAVAASVTVINAFPSPIIVPTDAIMVLLCLTGTIQLPNGNTLAPFDCAFFESYDDMVALSGDSTALLIRIASGSKL